MSQIPQRQRLSAIGRPRPISHDEIRQLFRDNNTAALKNANRNFIRIPSLEAKYTNFEEIGHGTQGRIFRAVQRSNNQTVVVKQLNVEQPQKFEVSNAETMLAQLG